MARERKFGPPDTAPFSFEDAQFIAVEVIGSDRRASLLLHRLNEARDSIRFYQTHDAAGGPHAREKALASIARSRKTLPATITSFMSENVPDVNQSAWGFLRYYVGKQLNPSSPEAALRDGAVDLRLELAARGDADAIEDVFAAATAARQAATAEPRRGQADRHRVDVALNYLLAELLVTYEEVFQRPAGLSLNKEEQTGWTFDSVFATGTATTAIPVIRCCYPFPDSAPSCGSLASPLFKSRITQSELI